MVYPDSTHQLIPSDRASSTPPTPEKDATDTDPRAAPQPATPLTSQTARRVTPLLMDPTTPSRADAVVTRPLRYGWSPPAPLTPQAMHGEAVIDAATRAANEITILIVENEESNRMLMEEILRFAGYRCVLACNGLEALEVFEREHPHIILTDVSMPVMDGYEATMAIRGRPGGARVPIVAVTAHAMSGERERALRRGCTDYLAKPYRPHELLEVVERQLNKGSMQGGGSSSCGGGV